LTYGILADLIDNYLAMGESQAIYCWFYLCVFYLDVNSARRKTQRSVEHYFSAPEK
jgi:hypothetical protein